MISIRGENTYQFRGLSTDRKPINQYVGNGSLFIEMDTSVIYTFDAKNKEWLVLDWNDAASQEDFDKFKEEVEDEIEKIKDYSDVKDIVGTYADLIAYDTSKLNDNDVIEVLMDEENDNANTMYKWHTDSQEFELIGKLGPYYTKSESDARYPTSVQYDSTNKKITQTKNNLTTDVVTVYTLKTDMELNNVVNTGDSHIPVSGGTTKFTTGGAYTELNKKVDKQEGKSLSSNDFTDSYKNQITANQNAITAIKDGTNIDSFADVESALDDKQDIIDASHMLSADLVDDTNATHKFVTAAEKAQITINENAISDIKDGTTIDSFADVEAALATKQDTLSGSASVDITSNVVSVKNSYIESFFATDQEIADMLEEVFG